MEEKKLTDEMEGLLAEFDEMGFEPTTLCPNAEEYAKAWKNSLIDLFLRLCFLDTEQKAEIERLKEMCSKSSYRDSWKNKFFKAQEEIERLNLAIEGLTAENKVLNNENDKLIDDNELKTAQVGLLTGQVEYLKMCADNFLADYQKAQEEIERLTEERDKYQEKWQTAYMNELNLQKQVDELKGELEKAYEIERANMQAEIADAGTSCHWCRQQAVKDTAKEILDGLETVKQYAKDAYGLAEKVGVDIAINIVKKIFREKGVEVE